MDKKRPLLLLLFLCLIVCLLGVIVMRCDAAEAAHVENSEAYIMPPVETEAPAVQITVTLAPTLPPVTPTERQVVEVDDFTPEPETAAVDLPDDPEALKWTDADEPCYRDDIPLDAELQAVLFDVCEENGVPPALALGLIEAESAFNPYAVSETGCYGLCQLSGYFPPGLSPADNLRVGIGHLGYLLNRYSTVPAALTAYNKGHDDGTRTYANTVIGYAKEWEGTNYEV